MFLFKMSCRKETGGGDLALLVNIDKSLDEIGLINIYQQQNYE